KLRVRLNILDVDGTPLEGGTSGGASASGADGIPLEDLFLLLREVVGDHESKELTVETEDRRLHGLAQPDRVLGQCLEDGLQIEGGPPDHLEQLAGRRLLLERLGESRVGFRQLARSLLDLLLEVGARLLEYPDRRDDSPGEEKAGQDRETDHED